MPLSKFTTGSKTVAPPSDEEYEDEEYGQGALFLKGSDYSKPRDENMNHELKEL